MGHNEKSFLLLGRRWTPAKLDDAELFVLADQIETAPGITRWIDLSGDRAHAFQDVTADKPTLNGSAIEFDGAGTHLELPTLSTLGGAQTVGVAIQHLSDNAGGVGTKISTCYGNPNANGLYTATTNHTPSRRRVVYCVGTAGVVDWGNATLDPETWVARHDGPGANADFCLDGAHQSSQSVTQCVAPAGGGALGARTGGTVGSDCWLWGNITYDFRLSDAHAEGLSAYLTALRTGGPLPAWNPVDPGLPVHWVERPDRNAGLRLDAWENKLGAFGGSFVQAVNVEKPVLIPSLISGTPGLHFDDADDEIQHDGAASLWNFLHDGTGGTFWFVIRPTEAGDVFDTGGIEALIGTGLLWQASGSLVYRVHNGTGFVVNHSTGVVATLGDVVCCIVRLGTADSPQYDVRVGGASVGSGSFLLTPSTSDASYALQLGDRISGTYAYSGGIKSAGAVSRYIDDTECEQIEKWAGNWID